MLEEINALKNALEMDANYFYTTILTAFSILLSILIPIITSCLKAVGNGLENRLWVLYEKKRGDMFFPIIMGLESFGMILWMILWEILDIFLTVLNISSICKIVLLVMIEMIVVKVNIKFVLGRLAVRSRIVGNSKGRCLIRNIIIIIHFLVFTIWLKISNLWVCLGSLILLIVTEIQGLNVFKVYTQYKYSSVRIFLSNGKVIDCKDISKIQKRYSSLLILEEDRRIRIKYDAILEMEYYGDVKIIV